MKGFALAADRFHGFGPASSWPSPGLTGIMSGPPPRGPASTGGPDKPGHDESGRAHARKRIATTPEHGVKPGHDESGRAHARKRIGVTPEHGFTLLEVIVALVVFGLLLTTLAQGTRFALAARDAQESRIAADQDLDAMDRTLRRLVGTMDPGIADDGLPHFVANARSVSFTTALPASAPFQAWQADVVIAVDGAHRLVLRWAPHYPALLGRPPLPQVTPLLEGLDHIELSYWANGAWTDRWNGGALPELVRFRIVFPPGDRRHWPDVVAATSVN